MVDRSVNKVSKFARKSTKGVEWRREIEAKETHKKDAGHEKTIHIFWFELLRCTGRERGSERYKGNCLRKYE